MLKDENRDGYLMVSYRDEIAELISFLIFKCCNSSTGSLPSAMISKLVKLITPLHEAMHVDLFKLGPIGFFSEYRFHIHMLLTVLVILRAYDRYCKSKAGNYKEHDLHTIIAESVNSLFPVVMSGFGYILQGILSDDTYVNMEDLSILFTLMIEISNSMKITHGWVPFLDRNQVIDSLLSIFSKANYISNSRFDASCTQHILEVLLAFSKNAITAEVLATHGIMACFSNNCFSSPLIEGSVEPYSSTERNPIHAVWCLIMPIVANLLLNLGESSQFVQEVYGLIRIYQCQIIRSLNILTDHPLSMIGLEETLRASELFFALANASQGPEQSDILFGYQDFALRLVSKMIYLFKSPIEFQKTAKAISVFEKAGLAQSVDIKSDLKTNQSSKFLFDMERRMFLICRNIVSHFRWTTKADLVLKNQIPAKQKTLQIFQITMQTQGIEGCSLGSLFDMIRILLSILSKQMDNDPVSLQFAPASSLVFVCESIMGLIVSQFAIGLCLDEAFDGSLARELSNEITHNCHELKSVFRRGKSCRTLLDWNESDMDRSLQLIADFESFALKLI
jgi:hypothetical protein